MVVAQRSDTSTTASPAFAFLSTASGLIIERAVNARRQLGLILDSAADSGVLLRRRIQHHCDARPRKPGYPAVRISRVPCDGRASAHTMLPVQVNSQPEKPRAPFENWRVHKFHPDYGFIWYSSLQRVLVTQTTVSYAHPAGGRIMSDWIDLALREDAAGIDAAKGIFLFHDFRSLTGYAGETRILINERIKLRKPGYARRTIMVVQPTPIWRMAMHVTDLTFAILGMPPALVTADMTRAFGELRGITIDATKPAWLDAPRHNKD